MAEHNIASRLGLALRAADFEALTVSTAAVPLTPAKLDGANLLDSARVVRITVEAQPIRYRTDGTVPTATVGHLAAAGDVLWLYGSELAQFSAIRSGASDATLHATFYR